MFLQWLTRWQMVTLIAGFLAVIAVAAVALLLGKEAVMSLAALVFLVVVAVNWLVS